MIKIEYRRVSGRIMPHYSVWLTMPDPSPPMLVGFVNLGGGSWIARLRSDGGQSMSGWPRRTDAAAWLLIAGGLAQQRRVAA